MQGMRLARGLHSIQTALLERRAERRGTQGTHDTSMCYELTRR